MLLAAAGLTKGRRVTTHHDALDDLRATDAQLVDGASWTTATCSPRRV